MRNAGLGSWPTRRRIKSAGRPALVAGAQTLTHDELADLVDRLANALRAKGIGKGDRIAYLGENHPAYLQTLFAAGLLGAVFVPINTRLAVPEVRFILEDCGARLLVHAAELTPLRRTAVEAWPVVTGCRQRPAGRAGRRGGEPRGRHRRAGAEHIDEPVTLQDPRSSSIRPDDGRPRRSHHGTSRGTA